GIDRKRARTSSSGSSRAATRISSFSSSPRASHSSSAVTFAGLVSRKASSVATVRATSCQWVRWAIRSRPDQPWAPSRATPRSASASWSKTSYGRHAARSSSRNSRASKYMYGWYSDRDRLAILAEDLAQDGALLAERHIGLGAAQKMGHQVRLRRAWPGRRITKAGQGGLHRRGIPLPPRPIEPVELASPGPIGNLEERDRQALSLIHLAVDPHDRPLTGVELALESIGRVGNLALGVALGDRLDHPAATVDLVQVAPDSSLGGVRQRFDEPAPAERVERAGDPGLLGDDLLLAQGQQGCLGG